MLSPQWATRSISKKPGPSLFQSAKVRIGMLSRNRVPGLVVLKRRRPSRLRIGPSSRSMVDGLISTSWTSASLVSCCSPCRRSTPISSGTNGCSRREHTRPLASHNTLSARANSSPYRRGRPRRYGPPVFSLRPSNRTTALRWYPVTLTASSSIRPFSILSAPTYRPRIATMYSFTPAAVIAAPFGNMTSEATIPLSVTFIMSQFALYRSALNVARLAGLTLRRAPHDQTIPTIHSR